MRYHILNMISKPHHTITGSEFIMKKTSALLLLLAALLLFVSAQAAVTLPDQLDAIDSYAFYKNEEIHGIIEIPQGVSSIGAYAFAYTDVYGLKIPDRCTDIGSFVLAGTNAAYIHLNSYRSLPTAVLNAVSYVFVESGMDTDVSGKYINMDYVIVYDGMYYLEEGDVLSALCPVDRSQLGGSLAIPKTIGDKIVGDLSRLVMPGCEDVTLYVPIYLNPPASLNNHVIYRTYMSMSTPEISGVQKVGSEIRFSVTTYEPFGEVHYTFTLTEPDGTVSQFGPTLQNYAYLTPRLPGSHKLHVKAADTAGEEAEAEITFNVAATVNAINYRALLIGNTYPGAYNDLDGPQNDIKAMEAMLKMYTGSKYNIVAKKNCTADQMKAAISSAFAGADSNDISLFYFSGHGVNSSGSSLHGALCGVSSSSNYDTFTYLSVQELRTALDQIPGTKIVLLDCCHSGHHIGKSAGQADSFDPSAFTSSVISAFASAPKAKNASVIVGLYAEPKGDNNLATPGYVVMTACSSAESSYTLTTDYIFWYGAFTQAVCAGSGYEMRTNSVQTASADLNNDNAITLIESYNRTAAIVSQYGAYSDFKQSTQYYGDPSFILWFK